MAGNAISPKVNLALIARKKGYRGDASFVIVITNIPPL